MLRPEEIEAKERAQAATEARPEEGVAALWVRRYREDILMLLERLEEARAERDVARGKLERIREQAAYGFTGETLENIKNGMSAREMNAWWMERITAFVEKE